MLILALGFNGEKEKQLLEFSIEGRIYRSFQLIEERERKKNKTDYYEHQRIWANGKESGYDPTV